MAETINLYKLAMMVVLYEGHYFQQSLFNGQPLGVWRVKSLLGSANSVLGNHWRCRGKAPARVT